jgi:hypothetical protein
MKLFVNFLTVINSFVKQMKQYMAVCSKLYNVIRSYMNINSKEMTKLHAL